MSSAAPAIARDGARTLALGGIGLVIAGLVLGEIYAIFVSHVANGAIKAAWVDVIRATTAANQDMFETAFARILELSDKRGRFMSTHSHIGAYGLTALALAVIYPGCRHGEGRLRLPALLFVGGAWGHITGTFVTHYFPAAGSWVALAGQIAVGLGLLGFVRAWLRGDATTLAASLRPRLRERNSRRLLGSGLVLATAGMAFGLWFAIGLTQHLEPGMFDAMRDAVSASAGGATDDAARAVGQFKRLQSQIAITAAAHSHAIEFGFLLMLLAFVEPLVMLSWRWRSRWTLAVIAGACLLPVAVFLATIYGLAAAAIADLAGGLVLIGLTGMFVGVLRTTGAEDSREVFQ